MSFPMRCPDEKMLRALLAGSFDFETLPDFDEHLNQCPNCQAAIEKLASQQQPAVIPSLHRDASGHLESALLRAMKAAKHWPPLLSESDTFLDMLLRTKAFPEEPDDLPHTASR